MDRGFLHEVAVPAGAEILDGRNVRQVSPKRIAGRSLALAIAIALHLGLLVIWRTTTPPISRVPATEPGSGGISLELISGRSGGVFAQSTANSGIEAAIANPQTSTPSSNGATNLASASGEKVGDDASTDQGHSIGGLGSGVDSNAASSLGSGYDPGAFVSLAPSSFSAMSQPGLWDQVRRCLADRPPSDTVFTVVLDQSGTFIDAYAATENAGSSQMSTKVVDALKACSPYHDVPGGLARRLTLVVPGSLSRNLGSAH